MLNHIHSKVILHNGVEMPMLGLGVYKAENGKEVVNAVKAALHKGYRSIDTAAFYNNEEGVGQAIKESNVPRKDIIITTKVWNTDQGYEETLAAFQDSLNRLSLDYIDLYLIHWPIPNKYKDTWRALEKLYQDGKARAIGVCNFHIHHLEDLMKDAKIKPMVNQVELHPCLSQVELRAYCKENNIQIEAWSPLMRGRLVDNELLMEIGKKYNKTSSQVILRWDLQHGIVTIPKSVHENRIIENANIFDFELSLEDMGRIDGLNQNIRTGLDPDTL